MKEIIVTLSNGVRIANFSSPHPFTFTDGTRLPAVDEKTVNDLSMEVIERPVKTTTSWSKIKVDFRLTDALWDHINNWVRLYDENYVDLVIVPLPIMKALYNRWSTEKIIASPFVVVRMADRVKKIVEIDKFCI